MRLWRIVLSQRLICPHLDKLASTEKDWCHCLRWTSHRFGWTFYKSKLVHLAHCRKPDALQSWLESLCFIDASDMSIGFSGKDSWFWILCCLQGWGILVCRSLGKSKSTSSHSKALLGDLGSFGSSSNLDSSCDLLSEICCPQASTSCISGTSWSDVICPDSCSLLLPFCPLLPSDIYRQSVEPYL